MFKFLMFLVASLVQPSVLRCASIQPQEQEKIYVETLINLIRSEGEKAANSIKALRFGNHYGIQTLIVEGNDLAHHIHETVYHLQQTISHNEDGPGHCAFQKVVSNLNKVVYAIQHSLLLEPFELNYHLRNQIGCIIIESERLASVSQLEQQPPDAKLDIFMELNDIIVAFQQIHIRNKLDNLNLQEIALELHSVLSEAFDTIQKFKSCSEKAVYGVIYYSHHFSHHLVEIIYTLQREIYHCHGNLQITICNIVSDLIRINYSLEHTSYHISISTLQCQLIDSIRDIAIHLFSLTGAIHPANKQCDLSKTDGQILKNVIYRVIAQFLAAIMELQRNIEDVITISRKARETNALLLRNFLKL